MGKFAIRCDFQSYQIIFAHLTMKSLSASVISSEPISVKAASRILSRFISKENGASKSVSSYLKRTSLSINELIQFHRELKSHQSSRRLEKSITVEAADGQLTEGAAVTLKGKKSRTETETAAVERRKGREESNSERRKGREESNSERRKGREESNSERRKGREESNSGRRKGREESNSERGNGESRKKRKVVEMADKGEASTDEEHQKKMKKRKRRNAED